MSYVNRSKRLRIALLMGPSRRSRRELLCGIADYARIHGPWSFCHQETSMVESVPQWATEWGADGILARIENPDLAKHLRRLTIPVIDLCGTFILEGVPAIDHDYEGVARLASEHFLERGFENFAYYGVADVVYSEQCECHFAENIEEAGYELNCFHSTWDPHEEPATAEVHGLVTEDHLTEWLEVLPKPVALMACNDYRAQKILEICALRGFIVPDEVAVLGVGNDEVLCELSDPPLTSIDPNARTIGYQAAERLEKMIRRAEWPKERILVAPAGMIIRQSTDTLAIADRAVVAAVRFIREHACSGIRVEEVRDHVRLSQSTLERRFQKSLGHSPKTEILGVQLLHIKKFLTETDYTLPRIAELVGFHHVENMGNFFKAQTGLSPGKYRRRYRPRDST